MARLVLLLLLCPLLAHQVRVLSSGRDVAEHQEGSGAELLHSSLAGQDTVTICARFLTYQFTHHGFLESDYPAQVLLQYGWNQLLESNTLSEEKQGYRVWAENFNLLWQNGITYFRTIKALVKVDWRPAVWNTACFTLSFSKKQFLAWFNGAIVFTDRNYSGWHLTEQETKLRLMAKVYSWKEERLFSMFGAMTDVNIWNRSLSQSEVEQWSRCELGVGGNLLDWNTAQWQAVGLQEEELDIAEICIEKRHNDQLWVFKNKKINFGETRHFCKLLGGSIAVGNDSRISKAIIETFKPIASQCNGEVFSGLIDQQVEGQWVDANTGEEIKDIQWKAGEPNNQGNEDCAVLDELGRSIDVYCSSEFCPACRVQNTQIVFHLQGICTNSFVDRFYILQSSNQLLGYIQTKMFWSEENKRWEIVNLLSNNTAAFMNDSSSKFPLPIGFHPWYFTDGSDCIDSNTKTRILNFHLKVDQPGSYCCDDGFCIDSELVCDGNNHCEDRSDEVRCKIVEVVSPYYNNKHPNSPVKTHIENRMEFPKTKVAATLKIVKLFEINEIESWFYLRFIVDLKWIDSQIGFNFLKTDMDKNEVPERDEIWYPDLIFMTVEADYGAERNNLFIEKNGEASLSGGTDSLRNNESFAGAGNFLHLRVTNRMKFHCNFDNIQYYPFGRQTCSFQMYIVGGANNLTDLVMEHVEDISRQVSISQYVIFDWTTEKLKDHKITGMHGQDFTVEFRGDIVSVLLVTYLPTLLMNIINQATNYISSPDKYELIITVNITCMMVLSSIYLAVSTSLPATAAIKPIEYWLLFSLVYPVLIIVINILIQVNDLFYLNENYFKKFIFICREQRQTKT